MLYEFVETFFAKMLYKWTHDEVKLKLILKMSTFYKTLQKKNSDLRLKNFVKIKNEDLKLMIKKWYVLW